MDRAGAYLRQGFGRQACLHEAVVPTCSGYLPTAPYRRNAANALHGIQEFRHDLPAVPGNHARRHQGHP
jgi:hypothetical protein